MSGINASRSKISSPAWNINTISVIVIMLVMLCQINVVPSEGTDLLGQKNLVQRDSSQTKEDNPKVELKLAVEEKTTTVVGSQKELNINCSDATNKNKSECFHGSVDKDNGKEYERSIMQQITENRGMLMRTLYVTLGVTFIVVVYFLARSFWLRRKRSKTRSYGVKSKRGVQRDLEMEPLGNGADDDEEDYTVFEANGRKK